MSPDARTTGDTTFAHTLEERSRPPMKAPIAAGRGSLLTRMRAALKTSPWASLAGRSFVLLVGLVVLAWIGRAATAATPQASGSVGTTEDAGLAPSVALPELPAIVVAPPPTTATSVSPVQAPAQAPPPAAPSSHARATPEDPVYINVASIDELRRLPGVGPKRAEAIVALRQRMGKFQRVEDLLRVKGVGRTTLRKWRPLLRLDVPASASASADAGAPVVPEPGIRAP